MWIVVNLGSEEIEKQDWGSLIIKVAGIWENIKAQVSLRPAYEQVFLLFTSNWRADNCFFFACQGTATTVYINFRTAVLF